MRAFLAFEVSPEIVQNLLAAEEDLRRTQADIKLVERENLHFTVKFLGDIPDSSVGEVDERVGGLALKPMETTVRGLGAFPDLRRPRTVWAGVSREDEPAFTRSAVEVIEALEGVGKPEDHEYHPHITVARVRSPMNVQPLISVVRDSSQRDFGRTTIRSLKLKSSTLTPRGPIYTDVREYTLQ